ncbi:hypothetical protein [Oceanicoccus sagamiensis]|uniref:Uncharacterized protein n=1 Tax=Oceanicoccus sagamiensis TaxID=716816 RepID=A0A1X9NJY5_9GAMM|nr:hypothetical protein [Oceanicoccus sagamiensis]ARN74283.1 hypothetical protein BST96_09200 [Oceanicoccus sagamiensis]
MSEYSAESLTRTLIRAEKGDTVVCSGGGRFWVSEYKFKKGKYVGPQPDSNTDIIQLEDNTIINLYVDEYYVIERNIQ